MVSEVLTTGSFGGPISSTETLGILRNPRIIALSVLMWEVCILPVSQKHPTFLRPSARKNTRRFHMTPMGDNDGRVSIVNALNLWD
jgi:hypothetical protein